MNLLLRPTVPEDVPGILALIGEVYREYDCVLDAEGELTGTGTALRAELEEATDRMDAAPYEHLGADGVARLTELGRGFLFAAASAGAFPEDLVGKG